MSRVLAAILLVFAVFVCGDPVDVEKRFAPVGPYLPGLDLLGKGGLSGDLLITFLQGLAQFLKSVRITLEGLQICPHKKGDYKGGVGGHYEPGYVPGYEPGYVPDYKPGYEPGYEPGYVPGYEPGYAPDYKPEYKPDYKPDPKHSYEPGYVPGYIPSNPPSGKYKRGVEHSKVDLACQILKPLIEAAIKIIRQLEIIIACMLGKDKGYKGDYKECHQGSGYDYSHGHKGDHHYDYKSGYPNDYKSGY